MEPESNGTSLPLRLSPPFKRIVWLDNVDSTNDQARRWIAESDEVSGTVVVANKQSRGRGRLGRVWQSPENVGLWVSIVLQPARPVSEWFLYTLYTAVTVADAIESMTGIEVHLKWPNDVLVRGRKCCGILLETIARESNSYLIVGAGINVNQETFPGDLKDTATSIRIESGHEVSRRQLLETWLRVFSEGWDTLDTAVLQSWKKKVQYWGKEVTVVQGEKRVTGLAVDIDTDGALIIETAGMRQKIYAGDVVVENGPILR